MRTTRGLLAIPLLLAVSVASAIGSEVRDKAGQFSPEAIRKANADLTRIEHETNVPVTIETIASLKGQPIDTVLKEIGKAQGIKGLLVVIAANDHKIQAGASKEYDHYFNRPLYQTIRDSFTPEFTKNNYDAGLANGVAKIESTLQAVKAEAGGAISPTKPSQSVQPTRRNVQAQGPAVARPGLSPVFTIILVIIGILAFMFVIRMVGAALGAGRGQGYGYGPGPMRGPGGPGYGAPGYGGGGGGGGGFMSSLFGGLGGAMAGNWIYDQFSGRRHEQQAGYNPVSPEAVPPPDAGGDWGSTAGDGGGSWGNTAGDGGGDWGGGGGDGGGGGGGDWGGGGGGGDWGGGGGDGGSW